MLQYPQAASHCSMTFRQINRRQAMVVSCSVPKFCPLMNWGTDVSTAEHLLFLVLKKS